MVEIEAFIERLGLDVHGVDDAERIDRVATLERLRCATEAAQTEAVADFALSQRRAAAERGVPAARRDRGVGAQVALARGVSPTRGQQHVALAMILRVELFHTRAAFRAGRIDAFKATLIARETACLTAEQRALVDEEMCGEPGVVEALSPGSWSAGSTGPPPSSTRPRSPSGAAVPRPTGTPPCVPPPTP